MNPLVIEFLGSMLLIIVVFAIGNEIAIGATLSFVIYLGRMTENVTAINPAVASALCAAGKLDKSTFILYFIAEVLGGLTGFYIFKHVIKK
jgi:glycerol uptake facilitator-like aquaporin